MRLRTMARAACARGEIVDAHRARLEVLRERIVGREHRADLVAERELGRTRERRALDEQIGCLAVGFCQGVGEDDAALGIGVHDLNREPLARRTTSPGR